MSSATDYSKLYKEFFAGKFANTEAVDEMVKNGAEYGAKFNKIALDAAAKNVDLGNAWIKETLSQYAAFTKPQKEAADYFKVASEVMTAQAQKTPDHITKFAEIAQSTNAQFAELFMGASKEVQEQVSKVAAKAA